MLCNAARIVFSAILYLLFSSHFAAAQSNSGCHPDQEHTISFEYGNYDVISNIYVFLTSGNPIYKLQVSSIGFKSAGNGEIPEPIDIDLMFRLAIEEGILEGYISSPDQGNTVMLSAALSDEIADISFIPDPFCTTPSACRWDYLISWPAGTGIPIIKLVGSGASIH